MRRSLTQHRDRMLFVAPAGGHEDQFGKLRVQPVEERSSVAAQRAEVSDENAAATADQQVDGGIGGRSVPDRVLGTGRFAQRREQARHPR